MTYVFEKEMKLAPLKVEYVISSITNEIKVVDMCMMVNLLSYHIC